MLKCHQMAAEMRTCTGGSEEFSETAHQNSTCWTRQNFKRSIQCYLEFLHCVHLDRLGGRLGLEHARLLGERVDALLCRARCLLLQLQVEHAAQLEASVLLDLVASHSHQGLHNSFCLLCFQAVGLSN